MRLRVHTCTYAERFPRTYNNNTCRRILYMRIGNIDIYISIYICNVYIDIFTGESHMKASQGHDMRRAN